MGIPAGADGMLQGFLTPREADMTKPPDTPWRKNTQNWKPGDPLPEEMIDFDLTPEEEAETAKWAAELKAELEGDDGTPVDDSDWPELDDEADVVAVGLTKKGAA